MPNQRDPVENGIDAVFGLLIAGVIAFFIGFFWGKRQVGARNKTIGFSDTLEIDPNHTYITPTRQRSLQKRRTIYFVCMMLAGFYTFLAAVGVFLALVSSQEPRQEFYDPRPHWFITFALCLVLTLVLGFATGWLWVKYKHLAPYAQSRRRRIAPIPLDLSRARVYTVILPKTTEWQAHIASRFLRDILQKLNGRLTFQIIAEKGGLSWRILDLRMGADPTIIKQAIHAFYPNAEIVVSDVAQDVFTGPFYRYVAAYRQSTDFIFPILKVEELVKFDPLVNLTHEMSNLEPGERVVYTLFVADYAKYVYDQAETLMTVKMPASSLVEAGFDMASGGRHEDRYEPNTQKMIEEKLRSAVFQCLLLIQFDAPKRERLRVLTGIDTHITQFQNFNSLSWFSEPWPNSIQYISDPSKARMTTTFWLLGTWLINLNRKWQHFRLLLDTRELAALWHLPHQGFTAPSIIWAKSRQVQVPLIMRGKRDGVYLGVNHFAGQTNLIYLPDKERLTHMAVIGKTGTGKSSLLHHLIHQDIARNKGVAVIDPHGHLVRDILQYSIPPGREDDIVILDIANTDNPPPFNMLASHRNVEHSSAAELLLAVFEKLYPDFTGRMVDTFSMTLQTLWEAETPTVIDVEQLFQDVDFRRRLVEKSDNFIVKRFWQQFETKSLAQQEELAYPVIHRMRAFYGNRTLRYMTCHRSPLDLSKLMSENKIILVSLALPEAQMRPKEKDLLGAILVSQLQLAAMGGAIRKPPYFLYIDEAQHFVTTALPETLTGARKFGLALVLANQFFKQLAGDTLDAVWGTMGATIAFQCSEHDARIISRQSPGFETQDLMQLDKFKAGVYVRYNNENQPAFSLQTLDPLIPENRKQAIQREFYLRSRSTSNYTPLSRSQIEAWLTERYAAKTADASMDVPFYDPES